MNSVLLILVIGAVSVYARKHGSGNSFEIGKQMPKQPSYMPQPTWNMPSNPINWPGSSSQPLSWQNQPSLTWPSQPSMIRPNQPIMNWPNQPPLNWPNQPTYAPGSFGQGYYQTPSDSIPMTNANWQSPQGTLETYPPSYVGYYPNPQMYLYRTKKTEKS